MAVDYGKVANRAKSQSGSATVKVMDMARRLKAEGRDVVDLSGGDPDFPTAPHVTQAAVQALQGGLTHYGPSRGQPELLKAISGKFSRDEGLAYDPKTEILVVPGGKQGIFVAAQALLNPDDEVILFDPCWVSYAPCAEMAGARAVYVPMRADTSPAQLRSSLEQVITPRTRLVLVNSPNNPTGQVWSREQLQVVADAAERHDFWVLSDEIYEKLVFDGRRHVSIATLPGMKDRTLVLNGLSKSHAMTGWRVGYVAGPAPLIEEMLKVHQHSATCVAGCVQMGAAAALTGPQDYTEYMVERYRTRRDALVAGLNAIPGIRCDLPAGAFYAFPNVAGTGLSDMVFAERLLQAEAVAVTPGIAFGAAGEGHVRLSFANSDEMLAEGCRRIGRFAATLDRKG
jgi:aspartate aminotransferase